ncbi:MAG: hypothetical protein WCV72_00120 [Patescibacteria group bacterium]|jgi:hypothetical protein
MESREKFAEITAEIENHPKVIEVVWADNPLSFFIDPTCFKEEFREFIPGSQKVIDMFLRGYYIRDKFVNEWERREYLKFFYQKFPDDYHFYQQHHILRKANVLMLTVRVVRKLVEYYLGKNRQELEKLVNEIPPMPENIRMKEEENVCDLEIEYALSVRVAITNIMECLPAASKK